MKNFRILCGILFLASVQWVAAQPIITSQPKDVSVSLGATAQFGVWASSTAPKTYQWWFKDAALDAATNLSAATRQLFLTNVALADAGPYHVVVTDTNGSVISQVATLSVDPTFTKITTGPGGDLGTSWSSGSWGDYDGNGYPDLYVPRYGAGRSALYRNNGDGTFTSIADVPFATGHTDVSGAWADFDNDGRLDLFVEGHSGSSRFYFNNGDGTFSTSQAFYLTSTSFNVAVADYNQDGLPDLFISMLGGIGSLYRNNGDRTFTRMTSKEVGVLANALTYGGAAWGDYDDDGWLELYAPNSGSSGPHIFHNDGKGRFVTVNNLVTQTASSSAIAGAWGDYDNDGKLDLCVAGLGGGSFVYRNLGGGQFEKATVGTTLGSANSAAWGDYDNDGFLDLFFTYQNALYHNNGDGTFTKVTTGSLGNDVPLAGADSYSSLWFDYDNDGFLDLYVFNGDEAAVASSANFLYHNNGNDNAWLKVKLVGTSSNRDGVGAKVLAYATYAGQPRKQRRDITAGDGFNGNHLHAHFGLGDATNVTTLRIEWPSGVKEEFSDIAPRQFLTIVEPSLRGAFGADSLFHLRMTGNVNKTYQLQASGDLVNWTSLTNCAGLGPNATIEFCDPAAGQAQRFYRLRY